MRKPVVRLSPLVAQRIAAGEVIERPHSIVRELMDNAVDAGASTVDVYLEQGGIESIRVIDNGHGMTGEDLRICCESHATSKIASLEDLDSLQTLGFRGEALSSIAACADLTIASGTREGDSHILKARSGMQGGVTPGGSTIGSNVEVRRLFHEIPGRKKFLKSSQAEGSACRKVFLDKALPFPDVQFRLYSNHELKLFLPKGSLYDRVMHSYGHICEKTMMSEQEYQSGPMNIRGVISSPALYRTDRSYIHIFVNRRRVAEYSLVQAVSHGYSSVLPGGAFPYCFLFLDLPSDTVDFNIHPAKKEVRFRGQREVHHLVTTCIRDWLGTSRTPEVFSREEQTEKQDDWFSREIPSSSPPRRDIPRPPREWYSSLSSMKQERPEEEIRKENFLYLGQIFNLFLLVQKDECLYIIDQHAAHERIIYDEISAGENIQPLLVPMSFTVEQEIHEFLLAHEELYSGIGIHLEHREDRTWEITALPAVCRGIEHDIAEHIAESAGDPEEIRTALFAVISCRAAVKDGEILDPVSARELVSKALALPVPRCPHGRPVWKVITREDLFRDVHRVLTGRPGQGNI